MSSALMRLQAASIQLDWKSDIQILVASGFIATNYPGLDPEAFTNATNEYVNKSGLPVELILKILCGLTEEIETTLPKSTVSHFASYLAGVIEAYRKENAPLLDLAIRIPADITNEIDSILKRDRPATDVEMGDSIFRWNCKVDTDHELYIDVINTEPTPGLSVTVTKNKKTACRSRPIRLKQWAELSVSQYEGRMVQLTWTNGHAAECNQMNVVFCAQ